MLDRPTFTRPAEHHGQLGSLVPGQLHILQLAVNYECGTARATRLQCIVSVQLLGQCKN